MTVTLLDPHLNLARSTVAVAPSPAASGTSLTVATGDGAKFPATSSLLKYNCLVWPNGADPTTANAELVRVTTRAADVFTITRAQESSAARSIVVGDQIALVMSAKVFTDIEKALSAVDGPAGVFVNVTNNAGPFAVYSPTASPAGSLRSGDALHHKIHFHLINSLGVAHTFTMTLGFGLNGVAQQVFHNLPVSVPANTTYNVEFDVMLYAAGTANQYIVSRAHIYNETTDAPAPVPTSQKLVVGTFDTAANNFQFLHTGSMDAASASLTFQGYPVWTTLIRTQ
jgi:hypothetical protein